GRDAHRTAKARLPGAGTDRRGPAEKVRALRQDRLARHDLRPPRPGGAVADAAAGSRAPTQGGAAMTQGNDVTELMRVPRAAGSGESIRKSDDFRYETVARLTRVTHRYGDVFAMQDVDIEIPAGRMIGFIGPDGVGKSTTLALIAGSRRIQTGTVEVLGGDIAHTEHRAEVCPRIAYIPQRLGKNLYPTPSCHDNLDVFCQLFSQPVT